ncbi:MAG TPA: ATP-binding protein [Polyangiales bacterium]|nr:ATP-binding protein [Polyangiales bacterium]
MIDRDAATVFAGGGELGARMREIDWSQTALGPVSAWPLSLKTCVRIILTSRQPMFVWWGPQLINLYNDAYKQIVGGKHPAALGQPAAKVWTEIWDAVGPRAQSALERNEGTYDEALLLIMERHGYPEETYYTFSYSPVPNDDGKTFGIICANTDDTQRIIGARQLGLLRAVAAETAHARSAEDVCKRALEAIATDAKDLPFAALYLSDGESVRMTGATPGLASIDWPIAESLQSGQMVVVDDLARFGELPRGFWPRAPKQAALVPIAGTSSPGLLVVGLNPYRKFDEEYRGFVGLVASQVGATISSVEALEQERRRAEALAELDRAKTAFFSNVSHEFRTPLTLMLGPLEDALASPSHTLSGENLHTTYRNSLRLLKLVNALLDFSRIEAGSVEAAYQAIDLAQYTADLASAFRAAIERAGLTLKVDVSSLGESTYVDRDMWEKIVLNLLSNALKFTFEGGVTVRLRAIDGEVELSVQDTGTGIPESELANVFKRFHRVQGSRSRTHEGSGIGLALVSELVKLHGGSIAVHSELGRGSRFTVRIPRGSAQLARERLDGKRPSTGSLSSTSFVQEAERWLPRAQPELLAMPGLDSVGGAHIVLADDNADMREYVTRLLRERWRVTAVVDGAEALEVARREPVDLVLSDIMMPNLDGLGLLQALRSDARKANVPIILLSARAGDDARVEGLEAGADDYLVKPFSARELLARVGTHLQLAALRKAAERERTKLYDIFMQAPVPVAVMTGDALTFVVANPAYCEMVGRSEVVGKTYHEVYGELADHDITRELANVLARGETFRSAEMNIPLLRRGVLRDAFFDVIVEPLRDGTGGVEGVVVVAVEITEQVLARRRIEGLRATAEAASQAKDEFLSTLSHELRTPLNAIIGWASLLRRGGLTPERTARALETVERNAQIQARLIEDMLDLSRIEQGKLVLSVGPLEMVRVVEAALEAVRPAADAKGVRLQAILDSHATIVGDADRLQQVVWNLLSNAVKFTPKGGRVLVQVHRTESYVEVTVADTGQGIAEDFLPFVFDRFRQADPSFTRKTSGLGLGLAIVRSLVQLHGGTVTAHSAGVEQGATFVVRLPTAPLRADRAPPLPAQEDGVPSGSRFEAPAALRGLRVLVVDDEPATRELLTFVLEQCDAKVTSAPDAQSALTALEQDRFDVLLSDIGMPEMDGYMLVRRLRALAPDCGGTTPAVALTAYARAEDRTKALRAGFNMHLAKPIDPAELIVVIETLVKA